MLSDYSALHRGSHRITLQYCADNMSTTTGLVTGKVAIITGGASGIGRSTVLEFAKEGAKVVIVDLDENAGDRLAEELNSEHQGVVAVFVKADVSSQSGAEKIVETAMKTFGTIDILFNNAGIQVSNRVFHVLIATQPADSNVPLHLLDESMWDKVINVNLKSIFLVSKAVIPIMLAKSSGVIINNSSGVHP